MTETHVPWNALNNLNSLNALNAPEAAEVQVGRLIDEFTAQTPGVTSTVLVYADGLTLADSGGLPRENRECLAAVVSGFVALARGAVSIHGRGRMNQILVDMDADGGFLCIMSVSEGSAMGVLCGPACDIGLVAYEAARLADRVGPSLTPEVRSELRRVLLA
ncbi:roadblock/LC7 domain-containing protein [Streptomyces sp. H27-C3]|uniref:roadblock/LC7 domain-containing protein n=1 Tax=Streptomyces sp. H27-C3 TaxID=3046305 RepID=UPI0024B8F1F9|nr:roadblock/LC7 domain-containing protein [Streptomyces sp. H27-C3]MDJ0466209.1 roadblock/LC7 domain-containing protein [Streptomyces sp. H27-C3]